MKELSGMTAIVYILMGFGLYICMHLSKLSTFMCMRVYVNKIYTLLIYTHTYFCVYVKSYSC